jgi:hypothetical protein
VTGKSACEWPSTPTGILGKRNQQRDRQISMRIYSKQQMKTQAAPQRCASWLVHVFSERPHFLLGTPLARRWPHQDRWTCRHPCSTLASDSVANVLPRFEEPQGYHRRCLWLWPKGRHYRVHAHEGPNAHSLVARRNDYYVRCGLQHRNIHRTVPHRLSGRGEAQFWAVGADEPPQK